MKKQITRIARGSLLLIAAFQLFSFSASAQQKETGADRYFTTVTPTNICLVSTNGAKVFSIVAQNSSAGDIWLMAFDQGTNGFPATNAASTIAPIKIPAGTTGYWDFGLAGMPFNRGLLVANSTTDRGLSNATAILQISVTFRKPN
jgi:hypothetical protein